MSFDIYFQKFRDGAEATFSRSIFDRQFSKYRSAYKKEFRCLELEIEPDNWVTFGLDDASDIAGFSVNRPPAALPFWDALHRMLQDTGGVLYWPGGGVVSDPEALPHLPAELRDVLSDPSVALNTQDILDAIAETGRWTRVDSALSDL
jgi:hypothetical protein